MQLRRVTWWARRLRVKRVGAALVIAVGALVVAWVSDGASVAALGGISLIILGVLVGRRVRVAASRLFLRPAPWRQGGAPLQFGGATLEFDMTGLTGDEPPGRQTDRIVASGDRFTSGDIYLEVWVVASDDAGEDWTVAQEISGPPSGRSTWTSSVDGWLTIDDFDEAGRPNPYRSIHRLVEAECRVPLAGIDVVAWGNELSRSGDRSVVVAIATAAVGAAELRAFRYSDSLSDRRAHLVPLDPSTVAATLGAVPADRWRGGAVIGLLEVLERSYPGSWASLERTVARRWREKAMFARVERGTEQVTDRALARS